jgi:glc operon protein GlcG
MKLNSQMVMMAAAAILIPLGALAQQMPNPYGPNVGVEAARGAALAAVAEAKKNSWTVAAAVVDTAGNLVYFERMDNTQTGSIHVAQEKARASAQFKRPTKAFEEAIASGHQNTLGLPGAVPLEGGIPLLADNKIIGAIGVSGATSQQDGQCAKAGADSLAKSHASR